MHCSRFVERERGEFSKFSQKACMDSLSFRSISIQAKRSIYKIIYLGEKKSEGSSINDRQF